MSSTTSSIRNQLKVFKYGLFYFSCDKTICILKLGKISKVLNGANTKPGSRVLVTYEKQDLEAEIIAVEDDLQKLRTVETEFLCDKQNAHLFSDEPTCTEEIAGVGEDSVGDNSNNVEDGEPKSSNKDKIGTKRKKSSSAEVRPKSKTTKVNRKQGTERVETNARGSAKTTKAKKNPATVIALYSPGKGEPIVEDKSNESPATPSVANATFLVGSPTSSCSSIAPSTPQTSVHHIESSPSTPSTPSFYYYNPLPPFDDLDQQVSTPIQTSTKRQLIEDNTSTAIKTLENNIITYIDRKFEELYQFLRYNSPNTTQYMPTNHHQTPQTSLTPNTLAERQQHLTPTTTIQQTTTEDLAGSPEHNINSPDTNRLLQIRNTASSRQNFAVRLVREMFQPAELLGRNVEGVRGKQALDPARIAMIKALVIKCYPVPVLEEESSWRVCKKAIDSFLRKKKDT